MLLGWHHQTFSDVSHPTEARYKIKETSSVQSRKIQHQNRPQSLQHSNTHTRFFLYLMNIYNMVLCNFIYKAPLHMMII